MDEPTRRAPAPGRVRRRSLLGLALALGTDACTPTRSVVSPAVSSTTTPVAGPPPAPAAPVRPAVTTPAVTAPAATAPAAPVSGGPSSVVSASGAGTATEIGNGSRSSSAVALTFHGAGDPALAAELLALIDRSGIGVTVLGVGSWLRANPAVARAYLRSGHELGNHTMHHLDLKELSRPEAEKEIRACRDALVAATGSGQTWFRASQTQRTTPTIRAAAAAAGYRHCLSYDVDGLDWQDPTTATVVDAVLGGARGGSIVSLHLGHRVTVDALPSILTGLRQRGLAPVRVSELLA